MSIVLIRHGETALNTARVIQPADTPLSERGLAQARAVASRVAGLGLAGIVSSDLPRARMTADAIAAATGLAIAEDELLRERNFGALRGRPYEALGFDLTRLDDAPEGGESTAEFRARVARAFAAVVARRAALNGPLAVVCHGLVVREIVERLVPTAAGAAIPAHLPNTGVSVLDAVAPHAASVIYCDAHLQGAARDDRGARAGF
jgi:probable phosphoglycerate mutase